MDIRRLRRDLEILLELEKQGAIRGVDWNLDGVDDWIIIYGAFKLPNDFNLPDVNIKLPIPEDLYEFRGGKFQFYTTVFIDSKLRRRSKNGRWRKINRQIDTLGEMEKGWSFLCVIPRPVVEDVDVRSVFPIVQRWLINKG